MVKELLYICIFTLMFSACNEDATGGVKSKPNAMGVINQLVVIAEEDLWSSDVRDSFTYYFESAYPIMPRPEPMFDTRHFTPTQLEAEPLRKELRTYVLLVNLAEKESKAIDLVRTDLGEERYRKALSGELSSVVVRDKWARGQIIIYLMGNNRKGLYKTIKTSYPSVARRINQHDLESLGAKLFVSGLNKGLSKEIAKKYGISIDIPMDYQVVPKKAENLLWLRRDDKSSIMNIAIRLFPYISQDQMSVDSLIKYRNAFGRLVTSNEPNSYMLINNVDLPVYNYTYEIDGKYTKEIRGVWEMTKDYMGGPFASYVILDEVSNHIIFIDTFIYAPGKNKRDMMQELEYLVKSAKIVSVAEQ